MELISKSKLSEGLKKLKQNLSASPIVVMEDVESLVESLEVKKVNSEFLKKYFEETPQEELDKEWKEIEPLNDIGPNVLEYANKK